MIISKFRVLVLLGLFLAISVQAQFTSVIQIRKNWKDSSVVFNNNFSGARLNDLRVIGQNKYLAVIRPEFTPINPSSFYAFEIETSSEMQIEISIFIDNALENDLQMKPSVPWISTDGGRSYTKVSLTNWTTDGVFGKLAYNFPKGKTRIAAHNPFTVDDIENWTKALNKYPFVNSSAIGLSAEGRPVTQLTIADNIKIDKFVLLMGGLHPPEATGDKGLMYFVSEICSDAELSREFRKKHKVIVIPLVNPDGKYHGQWRGTLGGVDPNRDWLNQTQPEIKQVVDYFRHLVKNNQTCLLGIDFHSTFKGLFYKSNFGIQHSESLLNKYLLKLSPLDDTVKAPVYPSANRGTSLDFINSVLGCSAVTREFGYGDTDEMIEFRSRNEARILMKLLLNI